MGEEGRNVILGRENRGDPWEILFLSRKTISFRTQKEILDQQKSFGDKRYEVIVVDEEDYDRGRIRPLKPPVGYDFTPPPHLPPRPVHAKENVPEAHKNLGKFA